jgi:hypothetical protein
METIQDTMIFPCPPEITTFKKKLLQDYKTAKKKMLSYAARNATATNTTATTTMTTDDTTVPADPAAPLFLPKSLKYSARLSVSRFAPDNAQERFDEIKKETERKVAILLAEIQKEELEATKKFVESIPMLFTDHANKVLNTVMATTIHIDKQLTFARWFSDFIIDFNATAFRVHQDFDKETEARTAKKEKLTKATLLENEMSTGDKIKLYVKREIKKTQKESKPRNNSTKPANNNNNVNGQKPNSNNNGNNRKSNRNNSTNRNNNGNNQNTNRNNNGNNQKAKRNNNNTKKATRNNNKRNNKPNKTSTQVPKNARTPKRARPPDVAHGKNNRK